MSESDHDSNDSSTATDTVWVTNGTAGTHHTEPDCRYVQRAQQVDEREPHQLPLRSEECSVCAGTSKSSADNPGESL